MMVRKVRDSLYTGIRTERVGIWAEGLVKYRQQRISPKYECIDTNINLGAPMRQSSSIPGDRPMSWHDCRAAYLNGDDEEISSRT